MNINFELILVILTALTGVVALIDILFFAKHRAKDSTRPWYFEYSRSLFPIFVVVLIIRSFIVEPFRIPSGSLEPTLLTGDFILVNKFNYGLRLPVLGDKFVKIREPKVGDIVVFHWPANPKYDFIKRVIGVPGDHIKYQDKTLYINGKKITQKPLGYAVDTDDAGNTWTVQKFSEDLLNVKHDIYRNPMVAPYNFNDIVVPKGMYFVMGDNRDDSEDSRYWGFVPESALVGKAFLVWFSWNGNIDRVRWGRIGHTIT